MGTTNFGDDVFLNPWPFVCELYQLSQERGVVPEFELFDLGQVHALHRLLDKYGLPPAARSTVDFVMGVPGGMPGTADALVAGVAALPRGHHLVGHRHRPVDASRGAGRAVQGRPPARGHGGRGAGACRWSPIAQLVERAVQLGELAQRRPATPAEARSVLGLADVSNPG